MKPRPLMVLAMSLAVAAGCARGAGGRREAQRRLVTTLPPELEGHRGRRPAVRVVHRPTAADPAPHYQFALYPDGLLLVEGKSCVARTGLTVLHLDAERMRQLQQVMVGCEALRPDPPQIKCVDGEALSMQCRFGAGVRPLETTCGTHYPSGKSMVELSERLEATLGIRELVAEKYPCTERTSPERSSLDLLFDQPVE
jgi:hypothetical protein